MKELLVRRRIYFECEDLRKRKRFNAILEGGLNGWSAVRWENAGCVIYVCVCVCVYLAVSGSPGVGVLPGPPIIITH